MKNILGIVVSLLLIVSVQSHAALVKFDLTSYDDAARGFSLNGTFTADVIDGTNAQLIMSDMYFTATAYNDEFINVDPFRSGQISGSIDYDASNGTATMSSEFDYYIEMTNFFGNKKLGINLTQTRIIFDGLWLPSGEDVVSLFPPDPSELPGYHNDPVLAVASPVPVPAAVWLFGSGLIGLVGFARRKKS